jgi:phospholipase B1
VQKAEQKYLSNPEELRNEYEALIEQEMNDWEADIPEWKCDDPEIDDDEPRNVHELRPQDVDVMASFGDSITAGNGVGSNSLPGVAIENRGESWTIGGNGSIVDVLTLPNIIKKFNPNVRGWSWSRYSEIGFRNDTHCAQGWNCAQLNVAEPGGTCRNMLPQAIEMTERMQNDPNIDAENDWKVVSLFIGGNDMCAVCRRWDRYNPEQHVSDIKDALDYLYNNNQRMLVNLITMFDVSPLIDMKSGSAGRDVICNQMHNQFCDCVKNETTNAMLRDVQMEYWQRLDDLINEQGTYDQPNRDDFTVVIQPHMRDQKPFVYENGTWDMTFFAPDCFHPSRKMHFFMAYGVWNTMLTPVQDKVFELPQEDEPEFVCPSEERPYIFTNKNSEDVRNKKMTADKETPAHIEIKAKPKKLHSHENAPTLRHHKSHEDSGHKGHGSHEGGHGGKGHGGHHGDHHDKAQQNAAFAVIGSLLGCLLVASLLLGVVLPAWRRLRHQPDSKAAEAGFDNPTYMGNKF